MSKAELIAQAIAQVNEMAELDGVADVAEATHDGAAEALVKANADGVLANANAEQVLALDESAAASAYDTALAVAKNKRETVRTEAAQAVTDATIAEQTTLGLAQDARLKVSDKLAQILETLQAAAAATA